MLSIIIPTYNEGDKLLRTLESVFSLGNEIAGAEIIVADDGSTDGSVANAKDRWPDIRVTSHPQPYGTAPGKALGADAARGDVMLFLDAHTGPSPGSIRLLESVAREYGTAAPTVDTLDPISWRAKPNGGGAGGYVDLWKSWQCAWLPLSKLPTIGPYRESWSVPGETFAIRRHVYDAVGGWDRGLVAWGSDSSLSLRLWCLGFPIVHVPQARIAHLFRKRFEQYRPRWWQILANRWRMMTSLATPEEFEHWISPMRTHSAWPEAMDYAIQHAHTIPRLQPRLVRSITDYATTVISAARERLASAAA